MRAATALTLLAVVLLGALAGPISARVASYGVFNGGAEGLGHLVEQTPDGLTVADRPGRVQLGSLDPGRADPAATVLVVQPRLGLADGEVRRLADHARGGGHVLIAGDSAAIRETLTRLPVEIGIGAPVYSPSYAGTVDRPIATGPGGEHVVGDARVVRGGTPILTVEPAWADRDGDQRPDLDEPAGRLAVAVEAGVGEGAIVVLGTPSPFTRAGWAEGPGPELLDRLAGADGPVLVDGAHRVPIDPLGLGPTLAGGDRAWLVVAVATAGGLVWALAGGAGRRRPDLPSDPRAIVRAEREVGRLETTPDATHPGDRT